MWLHCPNLAPYHYAQESEVSTSDSSSHSTVELFVTSSGKPSLRPFSWRGWKTRPWIQRLYGTILRPSTADLGVETWIYYLRATRASLSPAPERASETRILDTSGLTSHASSTKSNQGSLFSKTSKATSTTGSKKSSKRFPNWGMTRGGVFTQLPKPELHTDATECSSWPTATAGDSRSSGRHTTTTGVMNHGTTLTDACRAWPTPTAALTNDGESPESFLARQKKWAHKYHNSMPLTVASKMWPTAGANDYKGSYKLGQRRGQLDEAAEQRFSPPGPKPTGRQSKTPSGQRLNPLFVEWLMGLPIGWTDFAPLETE